MDQAADIKRWLPYRKKKNAPVMRIFFFPYVGGGASVFRKWEPLFPGDVELCSVQLPGRENRFDEASYTRMQTLVCDMAKALRPLTDIPYVLFGHSLGALIAFEFAREARRRGVRLPNQLFVSGYAAPQIPRKERPVHHLPEAELRRVLDDYQGTPSFVLQDEEMMRCLLPKIRADFELVETYVYKDESPLPLPITAFGGEQDDTVEESDIQAWKRQSKHSFRYFSYPGNHFFLHERMQEISEVIINERSFGGLFPVRR